MDGGRGRRTSLASRTTSAVSSISVTSDPSPAVVPVGYSRLVTVVLTLALIADRGSYEWYARSNRRSGPH